MATVASLSSANVVSAHFDLAHVALANLALARLAIAMFVSGIVDSGMGETRGELRETWAYLGGVARWSLHTNDKNENPPKSFS